MLLNLEFQNPLGFLLWVVHRLSTLPPSLLQLASSGQVALRHPENATYRCFLPDLTGFIALRCARPGLQHRFTAAGLKDKDLESEFNPAIADLGYRAPLVPRLARPKQILLRSVELCKATSLRLSVESGVRAVLAPPSSSA